MANILLVEDEEKTIQTVRFVLEKEGHLLTVAKNGEKAISAINKSAVFDLILLDLLLPGIDGFEVLRHCRQKKHLKTPIIILSNLSRDADVTRALGLGANDYLIKSTLSIKQVADKVRQQLKSQ